jgi:hypothetical protein
MIVHNYLINILWLSDTIYNISLNFKIHFNIILTFISRLAKQNIYHKCSYGTVSQINQDVRTYRSPMKTCFVRFLIKKPLNVDYF